MQPPCAIPPYHEESLKKLIGLRCSVPRLTRPNKVWWVTIEEVQYISPNAAAVWVEGHRMFGKGRWVSLADCGWNGRNWDDPLIQAITKARYDR
jgi:hypothetical protein